MRVLYEYENSQSSTPSHHFVANGLLIYVKIGKMNGVYGTR